jgi:hypothetical protein
MAENQVQIEVELVGQKEVDKGLESITKGAEGVGETFKSVGNVVGKTNQQLGEGLSSVSDALGETMGAVSGVKDAFVTLGQGGALSFTSLLGPISLVVTAVGAVYEAYRQLSGAAKEAEQDAEAMAAAANDLQSKLEALAEGGVILTADALKTFTRATIDAQVAKEKLIFAYEKLTTAYRNEQKAQAESQQLQQRLNELMKDSVAAGAELISVGAALARARQRETTATNALNQSLEQLQKQQEQVSLALAAAGKMQKQAEENTYDAVIAKVKELNERKKALDIMEAEASAFDDEIKALKKLAAEEDARARAKQISVAEDALNLEALKALRDELDRQVSSIEADVEAQSAQAKATQIVTDALKKQTEARKASAAAGKAAAAAALAAEQQRLTMQSQINLLDIQLTKEGEAQKLALIEERHRAGLEIAKDDSMKRAVVDKAYQLELKKLQDERTAAERVAAEERLKIEREARQQAIAFEVESQQFAIEHRIIPKDDLAAENQQRLDALGVRYAQEFILAQDNEVKLAEMQRRFAMERAQIEQEFIDLRLEKVNSALDQYGKGFAQAAAAAIWTSKSIGEAFKGVLQGLAQEATVSALMETAKGFAALILNPAAAGNHFAAAGIFGAAAVAAGGAAAAIPTAGAGGKNTATPTSPTGTPQTSTAPQRERAEASQIVYNVNFGGAVVYDTKRAAEMAMTQRLDRRRGEMRGAR